MQDTRNPGDYWNIASMVNPVYLKQKACEDVVKDPNGKRDEYDSNLETEGSKLWNLLQSLHIVQNVIHVIEHFKLMIMLWLGSLPNMDSCHDEPSSWLA